MNLDNLGGPVGHERRTDHRYRRHDPLALPGFRVRIDDQFHALPDRDGDRLTLRRQDGDSPSGRCSTWPERGSKPAASRASLIR